MNPVYTVTVSGVGIVRTMRDRKEALDEFRAYKAMSINSVGRIAGQSVTLEHDGATVEEYDPKTGA